MPAHKPFQLSAADLPIVEAEVRKRNIPKWKHNRYMILLLLHQDKTYKEIETRLAIVSHTIKKWKDRYFVDGLKGMLDRPRPGGQSVGERVEARLCATVQKPPPKGYTHWSARLISERSVAPKRTAPLVPIPGALGRKFQRSVARVSGAESSTR